MTMPRHRLLEASWLALAAVVGCVGAEPGEVAESTDFMTATLGAWEAEEVLLDGRGRVISRELLSWTEEVVSPGRLNLITRRRADGSMTLGIRFPDASNGGHRLIEVGSNGWWWRFSAPEAGDADVQVLASQSTLPGGQRVAMRMKWRLFPPDSISATYERTYDDGRPWLVVSRVVSRRIRD